MVPGGGGIAGVGVALLVVVAIVSAVVQLEEHSRFVKGVGGKEMEEDVKDSGSLVLVLSLRGCIITQRKDGADMTQPLTCSPVQTHKTFSTVALSLVYEDAES